MFSSKKQKNTTTACRVLFTIAGVPAPSKKLCFPKEDGGGEPCDRVRLGRTRSHATTLALGPFAQNYSLFTKEGTEHHLEIHFPCRLARPPKNWNSGRTRPHAGRTGRKPPAHPEGLRGRKNVDLHKLCEDYDVPFHTFLCNSSRLKRCGTDVEEVWRLNFEFNLQV
jgi:hypothetical protein